MPDTKHTETKNIDAAAYSAQGTPRDRVALPADTFDGTVNLPVMHQAVKAFLANQRQGNASTKTRGEVVGGNQKPWKQKGTGRARQGSIRAPNWVGGGTVFGSQPPARARDAVQRRLDVSHPVVGRGAGRVGSARRGDGAGEGEGAREGEGGAVCEPQERRWKIEDGRWRAGSRKRGSRKRTEVKGEEEDRG